MHDRLLWTAHCVCRALGVGGSQWDRWESARQCQVRLRAETSRELSLSRLGPDLTFHGTYLAPSRVCVDGVSLGSEERSSVDELYSCITYQGFTPSGRPHRPTRDRLIYCTTAQCTGYSTTTVV